MRRRYLIDMIDTTKFSLFLNYFFLKEGVVVNLKIIYLRMLCGKFDILPSGSAEDEEVYNINDRNISIRKAH